MHRFSTDNIPARDRLTILNDVVARHVAGRQFRPRGSDDLRVKFAAFGLPDKVTIGKARYSPVVGTRTRELLNDGRDNYMLTVHRDDHEIVVENGRTISVPAGAVMIVNEAMWSECRLPGTALTVISLERRRLANAVPRIEMQSCYLVPETVSGLPLLLGYADLLHSAPPEDERMRRLACDHLYDLAAMLFDGFVKGGAGWNAKSIRTARLELVKKDIVSRLSDNGLSIDTVARKQGVTARYIQRLFEMEGTTFSDFVRDKRLSLTFAVLCDAAAQTSISSIAFDAGFADLSSFNRSFKRRFGVTPSEVRADALLRR